MPQFYFIEHGPGFAIFVKPGSYADSKHLFGETSMPWGLAATSDGVTWSCVPYRLMFGLPLMVKEIPGTWVTARSLNNLPPEAKPLYQWAAGVIREKAKTDPEAAALQHTFTTPAQAKTANVTLVVPGLGLTLVSRGYDNVIKRNATRTETDILRIVGQAAEICAKIWGWAPAPLLEIQYHATGRAFGAAFNPGREKNPAVRRISLHKSPATEYDDQSVLRIFLHELCHFYRDETFPMSSDAHDRRFVEELRRVDPTVAEDARFFSGAVSVEAAAVRARKAEKVTWTPDAGALRVKLLKDGTVRFIWEPRAELPKENRWRPVKVASTGPGMLEFIRRFSREDRARAMVVIDDTRAEALFAQIARVVQLPVGGLLSLHNFLTGFSAAYNVRDSFNFLSQEAANAQETPRQ
jgi:hypothetical protein